MNYDIHRTEKHEKLQRLGGSEDLQGAHTLAAAWFSVALELYPTQDAGVAIFDSHGVIVGQIGWVPPES